MASAFFGSIGSGITNTFNSAVGGIGSGISYFNNSGVGHFFGSVLNSGSTFLSGIANIPAGLNNLVNGLANNSPSSLLNFFLVVIISFKITLFTDFLSFLTMFSIGAKL